MFARKILTVVLASLVLLFYTCDRETTQPKVQETSIQQVVPNAVIYEVNLRQYTKEGTFTAFQEHLPRLKELGVDILWLMPVHPISEEKRKGTLGSYYAVADYKDVNPEFGTKEDFANLVNEAHNLGMFVILDWVANHTGWDNHWITNNPEWYTKDESGNIVTPVEDWADVADLDYSNQEMRAAMIDALKYWVTEYNIDGYRCDVAGMVPVDFWEEATNELNKVKPVFMLAEAWEPELLHNAFDMAYAWDFHHIMNEIAQGNKSANHIKEYLNKVDTMYKPDDILMNFITNHDENSWNGTINERMGDASRAMAVLSYVMPGMPLIYSGQEVGLNHRLAFFEKDEINWNLNGETTNFYKTLNKIRKHKALTTDENAELEIIDSGNENVLIIQRVNQESKLATIINLSNEALQIRITDNIPIINEVVLESEPGWQNNSQEKVMSAWQYIIYE